MNPILFALIVGVVASGIFLLGAALGSIANTGKVGGNLYIKAVERGDYWHDRYVEQCKIKRKIEEKEWWQTGESPPWDDPHSWDESEAQ